MIILTHSSIRGQRAWWKSPRAIMMPVIAAFVIGVMITESSAPLAHESETTGAPVPVKVNTRGVTARIKYEAVVEGFLSDLNGKYKLRVTDITIAPSGVVGDHNHLGPGIRQVTDGKMEYITPDKTVTWARRLFFRSGQCEPPCGEPNRRALHAFTIRNTAARRNRSIAPSAKRYTVKVAT